MSTELNDIYTVEKSECCDDLISQTGFCRNCGEHAEPHTLENCDCGDDPRGGDGADD